jgi:tetratricopeptide (TPR) repeat protein
MFLRRRGVGVTPLAKRWLYATFMLSFLLTAIVSHLELGVAYSPLAYSSQAVTFLPLGITREFGDVVLPVLGAVYLASVAGSVVLLRRVASWSELLPTFVLMLTQALWFSLPFSVHYWHWQTGLEPLDAQEKIANYAMMIFIGHGLQYLWITTYYARAGGQWQGYRRYWAKAAAAGVAIWTLPVVLIDPSGFISGPGSAGSLFEVVATFVNLHHFVLDGAIWKLRNSRIAGVLIRSAPETDTEPAAARLPWVRGTVWGIAGVGLVIGWLGFAVIRLYVPGALHRGNLDGAETGIVLSGWLGSDEPLLRAELVKRFNAGGNAQRAAAHVERLLALRPDGTTYAQIGEVEAALGNPEAARTAFETAVARKAPRLDRVHMGLARLALRRGEEAVAAEHYRAAIALRPTSTAIANDLAWLMATAGDPAVRDVKTSLAVALQLVKVDEKPNHLDTLAAAYAADGRFDDAVRTASRAAQLAEEQRDASLLADIRRNLDRYRASQPALTTAAAQ